MSHIIETDICIIGAGSGGLSVAAGAVQMGARTVIVERGKMGGDCLNYGCVPSKSMLAAAKACHAAMNAGDFGIKVTKPQVDYKAVHDHVHDVIKQIAPHDSVTRFEGLGVQVIKGEGQFVRPNMLAVGEIRVHAKFFVIATGSSALIPPSEGLEGVSYLTNETIFNLKKRPDHLVIMGGGPIGVEMAQAHARLGVKVTLLQSRTILPRDDSEAVEVVRASLKRDGVVGLFRGATARVISSAFFPPTLLLSSLWF